MVVVCFVRQLKYEESRVYKEIDDFLFGKMDEGKDSFKELC